MLCVYIEKHVGFFVKVFFAVCLHLMEDGEGFLSFRNPKTIVTCLHRYECFGLGRDTVERTQSPVFLQMKLSFHNKSEKRHKFL